MVIRLAALALLLGFLAAAPAAASERSEARSYAAAMQGLTELTPEEAEALVAGMEARSAHVVATCLPSLEAASKRKRPRVTLSFLYHSYLTAPQFGRLSAWLAEGDDRLAKIPTRTRALRRGRAARRYYTRVMRRLARLAPADFCATVTAWEARGFKGELAEAEALVDQFVAFLEEETEYTRLERAAAVLKRRGVSRADRIAFLGLPDWPELREPAKDPVAELLDPQRDSSDGTGSREPWAAASGADAG